MQITEFITYLENLNFSLAVENGKLILKGDRKKLTKSQIDDIRKNDFVINYIKDHKDELIEYVSSSGHTAGKKSKDISSIYRLTGLQQGMLFHGLYDAKAGAYIEQVSCELTNPVTDILIKSWEYILKKHSILRSGFYFDVFNVPVQCVYNDIKMPFDILDYSQLNEKEQITALKKYEEADRTKGFDFKTPPLMRLGLFKLRSDRYRMLLTSHHILFDGWSMSILMEEFLNLYEQLVNGNEIVMKDEDKFEEYIRYIDSGDKEKEEEYWRDYMKGIEQSTLLPFISTTTQRTKGIGSYETVKLKIDPEKTAKAEEYVQKHHITMNTLIQGVWSYLLHKYTNNDDILYGVTVSGRPDDLPGIESRVGMYINTLPLHSKIQKENFITKWLQEIQKHQAASRQYQYTPLPDIKKWSGVSGDLFDSLLVFENYPVNEILQSKNWNLKAEDLKIQTQTNYPLTIIAGISDEISINFSYNSGLLDSKYMNKLKGHFENVLIQMIEYNNKTINDIRLLTDPERHQLLEDFIDNKVDYPRDKNIIDLFEEQVKKRPYAAAVEFEGEVLTYKELDERSNRFAHYLKLKGVKNETLVPICLERSIDMIIGILGILKAGGGYVPVDPDYPEERIQFIFNDSASKVIVSSSECISKINGSENFDIIQLDGHRNEIDKQPADKLKIEIKPDNIAYIIYTSGSTGRPKGVMIEHFNVVRLFETDSPLFDFTEKDVWTMFHSFCFDFSVWEMYGALFYGGLLVIVPKHVTKDTLLFAELLHSKNVTILNQIPSAFYLLQECVVENATPLKVRYVIFGGEALDPGKLRSWKELYPDCKLINMYGITETTVHVTYQEIEWKQIESGNSVIGKPIPTLAIHILDKDQNLLPIGIAGELCIGGAGLARGYLNRPELTAEKFIKDPFSDRPNARLYRSGDLGMRLPDGNIEYLGRIDEQVKIRGFRIELGEIENALNECELVHQAIVVSKTDNENNKRLVSYVVSEGQFDREALISYLKGKLPEYMIPAHWVELDSFPLTSSGKINKKALPDPDASSLIGNEFVAPQTDEEIGIANIWKDVLGVSRVGINDNFFELGGDSIKVIRVVHRLRKLFKKEIKVFDIYNSDTLTELIPLIENSNSLEGSWDELFRSTEEEIAILKKTLLPSIPDSEKVEDLYPMSDIQKGMLFAYLLNPELAIYHDQLVHELSEKIDLNVFEKALRLMVKKHSILRTAFNLDVYSEGLQIVYKDVTVKVDHLELLDATEDEVRKIIRQHLADERSRPFEISKAPLWRAGLIDVNGQTVFLFQCHHAIMDGWSVATFSTELNNLYLELLQKPDINLLSPIKCTFKDFIIESLTEKKNDDNRTFWKNEMTDYKRLDIFTQGATYQRFNKAYNKDFLNALIQKTKKDGLTVKGLLFGAYLYSLNLLTYEDEVTVGLVTNIRPLKEDGDKVLGCFLNTIPFRFKPEQKSSTWKNYFERIESKIRELKRRDRTTLIDIVKISGEKSSNENPFFDVVFNFVNFHVLDNLEKGLAEFNQIEVNADSVKDESLGYALTNTYLDFTTRISGDVLDIVISLRKNFKSGKSLENLTAYFENVIRCYIEDYEETADISKILPSAELDQLLVEFNDTEVSYAADKTVVDLFEEQVKKNPDNIAVVYEDQQLTYKDLNERSNQLAHYIQSKGAKPETLIPICMERSPGLIAGVLGILKAGCAYVPIDPQYPEDRINFMLEDSAGSMIISSKQSREKLPSLKDFDVIEIDGEWTKKKKNFKNPKQSAKPNSLAYVVYTSGSTGRPKGVMIEHTSIVNLIDWHNREYEVTSLSKTTQMAGIGFDAFGWEVLPYLSAGASVNIIDDDKRLSPSELAELFIKYEITHCFLATALVEEFVKITKSEKTSLKHLLTGGDKLPAIDIDGLPYRLINNYGPTENTVVASNYKLSEKYNNIIPPIGKPISNTRIYIVNKDEHLNPIGVAGEICIAGKGLARGYLNRPDLTSEKFITSSFIAEHSVRIYRTGDLARWLPDGNIEYLGRADDQVKIRGYRIELGEIENALQESELVQQSVVLVKDDEQGNKRLVGYVVAKDEFDKERVMSYLQSKLPEYMVPYLWVELESLPLTQNGKIDKKALPEPDASELLGNEYVEPRNETEMILAGIWKDLLLVERVGIHDNFFELGGDSIITIQVVSRARRLGCELKPKDIFIYQTIASLSAAILERTESAVTGEQGLLTGQSGLLPIQQWYFEGAGDAVSHFNQSVLLSADKTLTPELLNKAVEQLTAHHDALRFVYNYKDGQWTQEYGSGKGELITVDLKSAKKNQISNLIKENSDKYQRSLDIEKGEISRFVLIQTPKGESKNRLLIIIHHLAVDGVSWRIILDDLEVILNDLQKEGKADLGNKSSSYRQWFEALEKYGKSKNLLSQNIYWEQIVENSAPLITGNDNTENVKHGDIRDHTIHLDAEQTNLLLQVVPKAYHTEINDILLSALAMSLCDFGSTGKITIGLEGHGRENLTEGVDTSRTVGWFTNLYPVLLEVSADNEISENIRSVKEQLRRIPDKGLGYGVLKYINKDEKLSGKDCWDVVFNYLGQFDNVISNGKYFSQAEESKGAGGSEERIINEKLAVNGFIRKGELTLSWSYSNYHFDEAAINNLAQKFQSILQALIVHCTDLQKSGTVYTPSDYGLGSEISYSELDKFLDEPYKGGKRKDMLESIYRLSGLQEGMMFHGLYDGRAGAYTEQLSCSMYNPDLKIITQSWAHVLNRHSILRSGFYFDAFSIPVQCVYKDIEIPLTVLDHRKMNSDERTLAIKEFTEADRLEGFDFKSAPLMRITLFRISDDNYQMLWSWHHILFDGWSMPLLLEEFLTTYDLLISGKDAEVKDEDRFEDYIRYIERGNKEQQEIYWRNYMIGVEDATLLPFIGTTTQRTKGAGAYETLFLNFGKETAAQIENYAHKNHITINTLMQGVWSYLLHRYTGNDDVVYGIIVSGRPDDLPGVEQRVGMFINTLPLHSIMQKEKKISGWMKEIQDQQISSRLYQYTPIQDIQGWTGVSGDLFDSLLVFENYPLSELIGSKQWSLKVEDLQMKEQTNYPLTIIVNNSESIKIGFSYNLNLWDKDYVTEIRTHFENVLQQIIGNEESCLNDIELLTKDEENKLLVEFNDNTVNYPKDKSIMDQFEEQAEKTPDNIAIEFEETRLTYNELNKRSNRLANYLRSKGVKEKILVPVCIERSIEMIVGLLGIMKTGASYLPVDPDYPLELKKYMLEDSGPSLIVAGKEFDPWYKPGEGPEVIYVDEGEVSGSSEKNVNRIIDPDQILCVMYTSGSSGKPKGVKITDAGMVNRFYWMWESYPFEKNEKCVLKTSLSFGDHIWEIFGPLNKGVSSVLLRKADILDIDMFAEKLVSNKITRLVLVPSLLRTLLNKLITENKIPEHLKYWTCSGEALPLDLITDFYELFDVNNHKLLNIYGSTEVSADVTFYDTSIDFKKESRNNGKLADTTNSISENNQKNALIGKPIANCKVYIIDTEKNLMPAGISGEICIGGIPVGEGYLNRSELTAEKFIDDPFSNEPGAKAFRTGDIGRWMSDGNIEYMGRKDFQVKIRGFRVELGEIENELLKSDKVRDAVVMAKKDADGMNRLVGYVVSEGEFDKKEIVSYLKSRLPDYMVPALWMEMEIFPLTPSGKIDKKLLPEVDIEGGLTNEYTEPRNETEWRLAGIWKELLHLERVGIEDNFFELGGHSLLAMRLISAVRKEFSSEIGITDLFNNPTISGLAERLQSHSRILLPEIQKETRPERIPLSFSQERMWFVDMLEGSVQYHMPAVLRLKGKPDKNALKHSLQTIVRRHEILRTVIIRDEDETYQRIINADEWNLSIGSNAVDKNDQDSIKKHIQNFISTPFNLSRDYMLRVDLIELSETESLLTVVIHHIASDGWSLSIIVKEMAELYSAYKENRKPELTVLNIQYPDFSMWQRKHFDENILEEKLSYWKGKLEGVTPLQLPSDYSRSESHSIKGAVEEFIIEKEVIEKILLLSRQQGATLFMSLIAVFKVLLFRYSSQEDICVGTSISNRPQKELEDLIGFFVNMLALRDQVDGEITFKDLLHHVKETTLEAYENQDVPFEKVVDAVVKERNLGRNPLFQVLFILLNTPEIPEIHLEDVTITPERFEQTTSQFELSFLMAETPLGLQGTVNYRTDLYSEHTIKKMISHFKMLVNSVISSPNQKIGLLPMLTKAEEKQLLYDFNNTESDYPKEKGIAELFEEQVISSPDSIAVIFENQQMTYRELNERSNKVAHYLRKRNVKEEEFVPICIGRSPEMIAGILGILKAGATYVPIDPEYPPERISYMLDDINAKIFLISKDSKSKLPLDDGISFIELEEEWPEINKESSENPGIKIKPHDLAYVIYTSGSTGQPKGVMVTQRNVVSLVKGVKYFKLIGDDILLSTGSSSFDASTFEYWSMLLNGGKLVLCRESRLLDSELLKEEIRNRKVTMMWFTSSWFNQLIDTDISVVEGLKTILAGGEKLSERHIKTIRQTYPEIEIINGYGPTENTTFSLTYRISDPEYSDSIPIGIPLNNRNAYILNNQHQLCPQGVAGEICVGGDGLSRGYLNRDELTSEKFIKHVFNKAEGERLYKTGDKGRWLPDGNIEYLGRMDDQLKIRGYRIEPGEIENILMQSKLVKQAVVLAKEDNEGNKKLAGYIVTEGNFDKEEIVSYLKGKLPEYMIPSIWIEMESLPLTANGKVDKAALPDPEVSENIVTEYVAPRDEVEKLLAEIWEEVLEVERVGIYDNFFELGGDSIIIIQILSRFRRSGQELQVSDIFTHQTIAGLSEVMKHRNESTANTDAEQLKLTGLCGLLPIQKWFFEIQKDKLSHFNQSVLLSLSKIISEQDLSKAIEKLFSHHDALSFRYYNENGNWNQEYGKGNPGLQTIDLRSADVDSLGYLIKEHSDSCQKSLDIEKGDIVRVILFQTPDTETNNRILIIIHHLAVDGVSWRIILDDLELLLTGIQTNNETDLGKKTSSYRQWNEALTKYGQSDGTKSQIRYWEQITAKYKQLRTDFDNEDEIISRDIRNHSMHLDSEQTRLLLKEVPRAYHTEINDILLCALAMSLCQWGSEEKVIVGLEGHGRENINDQTDTSRTVGWFTNLYPVILELRGGKNLSDNIMSVKEQLRRIPDKGLGYGVLKYINNEEKLAGKPCWDIVFNYLGQLDNVVKSGKWLSGATESGGASRSDETIITEKLSVNSSVQRGELLLNWSYSEKHYKKESIEELVEKFRAALESLISHCMEQQKTGTVNTPSDFGLGSEISFDELDIFLNERL